MILESRTPYLVERTLLTPRVIIADVESLHPRQVPVEMPAMEVRYTNRNESLFWRG